MSVKVKQVLEKARDIVERGWHQGDSTDGRGNFCLRAAVGLAAGSHVYDGAFFTWERIPADAPPRAHYAHIQRSAIDVQASQMIVSQLPEPFKSIPVFNDDPDTTKDDVLAVLDKAISAC